VLLTSPLFMGKPDPVRAVYAPQREGDGGICSAETSSLGRPVKCKGTADTRDEEGIWVWGSSQSSQFSLGTRKALGVGMDLGGAEAGGLHGKLQAWVNEAVEEVLGWGGAGAQCRAGQCAGGHRLGTGDC